MFNYPLKSLKNDFTLRKESLVSLKGFVVGNGDNKEGVQQVSMNGICCIKGHSLIKSRTPGKKCDVCSQTLTTEFVWYSKL